MSTNTVEIKIADDSVTYVAGLTDAEEVYDGFGTIEVKRMPKEVLNQPETCRGQEVRLVLVREEHIQWQTGRYHSGVHGWWTIDASMVEPSDLYLLLWCRVDGKPTE